jgi:hypothetical protein
MAVIKALFFGGFISLGIFLLITAIMWIIPILTFLIIFAGVSAIAYAILKEDKSITRPP